MTIEQTNLAVSPPTGPTPTPEDAPVRIRFFAGAARAMGTREMSLPLADARPLSEVIAGLGTDATATRILGLCSWLVNARQADSGTLVRPGSTVDALPPFAGG